MNGIEMMATVFIIMLGVVLVLGVIFVVILINRRIHRDSIVQYKGKEGLDKRVKLIRSARRSIGVVSGELYHEVWASPTLLEALVSAPTDVSVDIVFGPSLDGDSVEFWRTIKSIRESRNASWFAKPVRVYRIPDNERAQKVHFMLVDDIEVVVEDEHDSFLDIKKRSGNAGKMPFDNIFRLVLDKFWDEYIESQNFDIVDSIDSILAGDTQNFILKPIHGQTIPLSDDELKGMRDRIIA